MATSGMAPTTCAYGFLGKIVFQCVVMVSMAAAVKIAIGTIIITAVSELSPDTITAKIVKANVTAFLEVNILSSDEMAPMTIKATVPRPNSGARYTLS